MYGLSPHRIGEILSGKAHTYQRTLSPRAGRFYPRLNIGGRVYSLGGFATSAQASAAYEAARMRMRLGEPVLLPRDEKPSADDIRRWYQPPLQQLQFGDREGELVIGVEAVQEQSTFIMHNALDRFHPKVRKFLIAASTTGDLTEAAAAAGLSPEQVAYVLPKLRAYLQRHL